jgi:hypothetical protein
MEIEMTDTEKAFSDELRDEALDAPRIHGVNGVVGSAGTVGSIGCVCGTAGSPIDQDD